MDHELSDVSVTLYNHVILISALILTDLLLYTCFLLQFCMQSVTVQTQGNMESICFIIFD